jgi:hypothetical protein
MGVPSIPLNVKEIIINFQVMTRRAKRPFVWNEGAILDPPAGP